MPTRESRYHAEAMFIRYGLSLHEPLSAIAVRTGVSIATISRALEKQKPAKSER